MDKITIEKQPSGYWSVTGEYNLYFGLTRDEALDVARCLTVGEAWWPGKKVA